MPKRVFDRSTSYESRVIDMHTGKPVPAETKPMICDRIRHYREELGMEQKALAAVVGVTANAVSNWERGRARPDVNLLPNICEALQITLYQLYGLDDPSVKYTTMEDAFMENYRQLTPGHQYAVRAMAQNLLQVQQAEGRLKIHKLTRFEHQLAAGIGDPNEFEDSGTPIYVYDDSLTCRADCVFTVNGDSMEPGQHGAGLPGRLYGTCEAHFGFRRADARRYWRVHDRQRDVYQGIPAGWPALP